MMILSPSVAFVIISSLALNTIHTPHAIGAYNQCSNFFNYSKVKGIYDCGQEDIVDYYPIPLLTSVYCNNDGSLRCKAIAGRFEFHFKTIFAESMRTMERSKYVDSFGYHDRVPVGYDIDGHVFYHDRVINWARNYIESKKPDHNLLSSKGFNWCKYAKTNDWPYKSTLKDGEFSVYMFNRQHCIFEDSRKYYNGNKNQTYPSLQATRLKLTSNVSITDYATNPLGFIAETLGDTSIHKVFVRNKHQFWTYDNVPEFPCTNRSMLAMKPDDEGYQMFHQSMMANLISTKRKDICLSSNENFPWNPSSDPSKWAALAAGLNCGLNEVEAADLNYVNYQFRNVSVYETSGFNQPVYMDKDSRGFFGFEDRLNYSIIAMTTKPSTLGSVEVFMIYKELAERETPQKPDASYLVVYEASFDETKPEGETWSNDRNELQPMRLDSLNNIDDWAYLYACGTILVIYGPLYNEIAVKNILDIEKKSQVGSIDQLGLNELTNAFFAHPESNEGVGDIYFYHRSNYVAKHKYSCRTADGKKTFVTGKKVGMYKYRHGLDMFDDVFKKRPDSADGVFNWYEERHFQEMGFFEGTIGTPDAPPVSDYPYYGEESSILVVLFITIFVCLLGILLLWVLLLVKIFWNREANGAEIVENLAQANDNNNQQQQPGKGLEVETRSDLNFLEPGVATIRSEIQQGKMSTNAKKVGKFIVATGALAKVANKYAPSSPPILARKAPKAPVAAKAVKLSNLPPNLAESSSKQVNQLPAPLILAKKQTIKKQTMSKKQAPAR